MSAQTIYTPYTYLIEWSTLGKRYYGVRYAKRKDRLYKTGCHPDDLWVTYFTSSKVVEEYRKLYGEPDIVTIRKTFDSANEAIDWEDRVLSRLKVDNNESFLNITSKKAIPHWEDWPVELIERTKRKFSGRPSAFKGRAHSEESKEKNRQSQLLRHANTINPRKGKKTGKIWVTKDNENKLIDKTLREEYEVNGWTKGRYTSPEQREKISNTMKRKGIAPINRKTNNRVWFTNGVDNVREFKDQADYLIEAGWVRGRTRSW